jgi:TPR repeat protein
MDEAYFWYSIAASRGDLTAAAKRLSLEAGLDTKTKLAIQTRLKDFHRQLLN